MRALVVKDLDKLVEPSLLLLEIARRATLCVRPLIGSPSTPGKATFFFVNF